MLRSISLEKDGLLVEICPLNLKYQLRMCGDWPYLTWYTLRFHVRICNILSYSSSICQRVCGFWDKGGEFFISKITVLYTIRPRVRPSMPALLFGFCLDGTSERCVMFQCVLFVSL